MTAKDKIREASIEYASINWDVHEKPNEYDNAYEDFLAGGDFALEMIIGMLEERKAYLLNFGYNRFAFECSVIINTLKKNHENITKRTHYRHNRASCKCT